MILKRASSSDTSDRRNGTLFLNLKMVTVLLFGMTFQQVHASDDLDEFGYGAPGGSPQWLEQVGECLRTQPVYFDGTIVDAAVATPALSTLVEAVLAADLAGALSAPGKKTVFAPTNDAFAAIPEALLGLLLSDPQGLLTSVLTYHVSAGQQKDVRRSFRRPSLLTLNGQRVFLTHERESGPQVNNSNIACQPVITDNGVVWVIDSVLLPQVLQP